MSITGRLARTGLKGAGIAIATAIATPFVWAGYTIGRWYYAGTKFAFRHPNITAAGIVLAGSLGYYASTHDLSLRREMHELTQSTTARIYALRTSELENSLRESNSEREHERSALEAKITAIEQAAQQDRDRLTRENEQYKIAIEALHTRRAPESPRAAEETAPPQERGLEYLEEDDHVFYYVKQGDTLSGIARAVSDQTGTYHRIAEENGITNPRELLTGQILSIPKELCSRPASGVYSRIPRLQSIRLPGTQKISDAFPQTWREVLRINRALGLEYNDSFPITNGARIVYHKP